MGIVSFIVGIFLGFILGSLVERFYNQPKV